MAKQSPLQPITQRKDAKKTGGLSFYLFDHSSFIPLSSLRTLSIRFYKDNMKTTLMPIIINTKVGFVINIRKIKAQNQAKVITNQDSKYSNI